MNVKTTLRLICGLLTMVLLCTFVACGDTPSDDPKEPEQPSTDTPSNDPNTEKIDYIDQVADAYFGGNTKYTILCRENKDYEMATGDVLRPLLTERFTPETSVWKRSLACRSRSTP